MEAKHQAMRRDKTWAVFHDGETIQDGLTYDEACYLRDEINILVGCGQYPSGEATVGQRTAEPSELEPMFIF